MLVGNGVTNWEYDCTPAFFHMSYYHGLISDDLFTKVNANCNLTYFDSPNPPPLSDQCIQWMNRFANVTSLVNVYDVFGKCWPPSMPNGKQQVEVTDEPEPFYTAEKLTPFLGRKNLKVTPPCVYAAPILSYFNNPIVRAQLKISPNASTWDLCASDFNYTQSMNATQWIWPILRGRYKLLKYSGDTDGAVPTWGTQQWIASLNWPVKEAWRPYYIYNIYGQQVAGYVEVRDGLTFVTVHGAGHMAPQFKRQPTYNAIFKFIKGEPL